jgi:EAL domain-containing protein (putative c-di-GMP-specific phosphodiesterase class I)
MVNCMVYLKGLYDGGNAFPDKVLLLVYPFFCLHDGELCLHYQPKISLSSGAVIGFEALLRWQHPRDGLILPQYFIPLTVSVTKNQKENDKATPRGAFFHRLRPPDKHHRI